MANASKRSLLRISLRGVMTIGLALSASLVACGRDSNPVQVHPGYPPSPYTYPIVNPVDSTIGFAYAHLLRISRQPLTGNYINASAGGYTYQFSDSGTTFWLVNWDGSNQRNALTYYLGDASWSPDGKAIIFRGQSITSMAWSGDSLDESTRMEYSFAPPYAGPKWNPAMTKIVMWNTGGIHVWTAGTTQISQIGETGWIQPDWSPEGSMLVFRGYVDHGSAVMVADTLGGNARVLAKGFDYLANPVWSPDGSRIAFVARIGNDNLQIWTVKTDGSGLTQITTDGAGEYLSWSPSGSEIVYVHYSFFEFECAGGEFSNGTIWRINPTTKMRHQITFNTGLDCP